MLSCQFDRRGCRHGSLFLSEYKRTNRTKGTKILRCFPHCCPEHVNRSYCGSALYVRLQSQASKRQRGDLSGGPEPNLHIDDLFVFAHFEEVGGNTLALGDELSASSVFKAIQSEQNPKGEWIEGQAHEAVDFSTHLYEINPGARWYYEWESAATKAQRFTKHVLKIYVFQAVPAPASPNDTSEIKTLRVVATTSSSEFMVVSYRRAPTEISGDRRLLAMLAENVVRQSSELGVEPDGLIASLGQKMLPFLVENQTKEDKHSKPSPTRSWSPQLSHAAVHSEREQFLEDRRVWESRHTDVLAMTKRLVVLYKFLAAVPAADFHVPLSNWSDVFTSPSSYDSPRRSATPPPGYSRAVSWSFLSPIRSSPSDGRSLPSLRDARLGSLNSEVRGLVDQCIQTVSWVLLDASNRRLLEQLLTEGARALLDKAAQREMFLRWTVVVHDLVDRFLATRFGSSFAQLHEDVVATLFREDDFKPLRAELLEQLSSTSMAGFELFVNQTRQGYIFGQQSPAASKRKRDSTYDSPVRADRFLPYDSPSRRSSSSAFSGAWSFDSHQCSLARLGHGSGSAGPLLSIAGAIEWMREFANVTLAVDEAAGTLAIRSHWSLDSSSAGMQLVLDGRKRVFEAFPSGVASTVPWNALACGDYRAQFVGADALMLEFTGYGERAAVRVKVCLRLVPGPSPLDSYSRVWLLSVDGVLEQGACDQGLATAPMDRRRHAVGAWTPTHEFKAVYAPLA